MTNLLEAGILKTLMAEAQETSEPQIFKVGDKITSRLGRVSGGTVVEVLGSKDRPSGYRFKDEQGHIGIINTDFASPFKEPQASSERVFKVGNKIVSKLGRTRGGEVVEETDSGYIIQDEPVRTGYISKQYAVTPEEYAKMNQKPTQIPIRVETHPPPPRPTPVRIPVREIKRPPAIDPIKAVLSWRANRRAEKRQALERAAFFQAKKSVPPVSWAEASKHWFKSEEPEAPPQPAPEPPPPPTLGPVRISESRPAPPRRAPEKKRGFWGRFLGEARQIVKAVSTPPESTPHLRDTSVGMARSKLTEKIEESKQGGFLDMMRGSLGLRRRHPH